MGLLTSITSGLLRDPASRAGDWGSVLPWPRSSLASRGPDEADDRTPVEEAGKEKKHFFADSRESQKADHMAFKVPNDLDIAAETPGYNVVIRLGYCSLPATRTTS